MPFEIDYAALARAMSRYDPLEESLCFFDAQTGRVLEITRDTEKEARQLTGPEATDDPTLRLAWHILWRDGEIGEELPEAEEAAMIEQIEACLTRYRPVPGADSDEDYQDMADFAAAACDARLRRELEGALIGRGAFRHFKDVLDNHPEERTRWLEFKSWRLRARVDAWLRQSEII